MVEPTPGRVFNVIDVEREIAAEVRKTCGDLKAKIATPATAPA